MPDIPGTPPSIYTDSHPDYQLYHAMRMFRRSGEYMSKSVLPQKNQDFLKGNLMAFHHGMRCDSYLLASYPRNCPGAMTRILATNFDKNKRDWYEEDELVQMFDKTFSRPDYRGYYRWNKGNREKDVEPFLYMGAHIELDGTGGNSLKVQLLLAAIGRKEPPVEDSPNVYFCSYDELLMCEALGYNALFVREEHKARTEAFKAAIAMRPLAEQRDEAHELLKFEDSIGLPADPSVFKVWLEAERESFRKGNLERESYRKDLESARHLLLRVYIAGERARIRTVLFENYLVYLTATRKGVLLGERIHTAEAWFNSNEGDIRP